MTWSLWNHCYFCEHEKTCQDKVKIQEGITNAHTSGEHKGAGSIIMHCQNYQKRP